MRIALVTGATSGLGRAFLQEWQDRGVHFDEVWLVARHRDALERTARELPWATRLFAVDLAQAQERALLFKALAEQRPQIQAVVNSAGYGKTGCVTEIPSEEQTGMIALNCSALVAVTQQALPYMVRGGVIYEIASVAAFLPQPGFAVYAATKAFVLSFARALNAEQHKRGVQIIAVCPNPMNTGFFARAGVAPTLIKRLGFEDPQAVARSAMRAASRGRDVSTNSRLAGLIRLCAKCLPHCWIVRMERWIL